VIKTETSADFSDKMEELENIDGAEESRKKNRRFKIIAVSASALAIAYFAYHIFSFGFNGYNSGIKNEFSVYETSVIESELGIAVPDNGYVKTAKYISGKSPVLMVWIEGIEDYEAFLSDCTGFSSDSYKEVSVQISENQSSAARYYSALKDGDSKPTECYIYKLPEDESWTVYMIENDVTYDDVKEMF
jgi:hypothetical protein